MDRGAFDNERTRQEFLCTAMRRRFQSDPESSVAEPRESEGARALANITGTPPKPATPQQIRGIVKRLQVLLGEAMEQGDRVGVEVTPPKLARVCDELLHEARHPGYRPRHDGSVEGFFFAGVFEDLAQQPSNIFDEVTGADGKAYHVPLTVETWIQCLETLRLVLSPSQ
jgi:hypothetical protein